jgi:cobalamin synthase
LAVLGLQQAAIVWLTVVLVTIAAGYYSTAIIGGVVGDFLGATIQVSC